MKRPKITYRQSKIPEYGPKETPLYYYDLTSIAIDFIKNFKNVVQDEVEISQQYFPQLLHIEMRKQDMRGQKLKDIQAMVK